MLSVGAEVVASRSCSSSDPASVSPGADAERDPYQ